MKQDLVTVIVLSYGPGELYEKTLQSVLAQDYPEIDLIISDDASERFDRRAVERILEAYQRTNIRRVLIRENDTNLGIPAHDNLTASLARGAFIKIVADGDTFCTTHSLQQLYDFAKGCPEDAVTSPSLVCSANLQTVHYEYPSPRRVRVLNTYSTQRLFGTLAFNNIISAVGMMFRPRFFENGGFDTEYQLLEDWPTWLRLVRNGIRIPCATAPVERYGLSGISSAAATAFESPRLKRDMLRCMEREILPYKDILPSHIRSFCNYRYRKLQGFEDSWEYTAFALRYAPFEAFCQGKAVLKKIITSRGVS